MAATPGSTFIARIGTRVEVVGKGLTGKKFTLHCI